MGRITRHRSWFAFRDGTGRNNCDDQIGARLSYPEMKAVADTSPGCTDTLARA